METEDTQCASPRALKRESSATVSAYTILKKLLDFFEGRRLPRNPVAFELSPDKDSAAYFHYFRIGEFVHACICQSEGDEHIAISMRRVKGRACGTRLLTVYARERRAFLMIAQLHEALKYWRATEWRREAACVIQGNDPVYALWKARESNRQVTQ